MSQRLTINGASIYVSDSGSSKTPIVFSHGLLWSHQMFDAVWAQLQRDYRCIAYDHRGQGRSEGPERGAIAIEQLTDDAIQLVQQLGVGPCHFVGLSMGGFVGLRLAARRPDLIRSLTLISTAADAEPKRNLPKYTLLNRDVGFWRRQCDALCDAHHVWPTISYRSQSRARTRSRN